MWDCWLAWHWWESRWRHEFFSKMVTSLGIKKTMQTFFQEVIFLECPDHLLNISVEPVVAVRPVAVSIERVIERAITHTRSLRKFRSFAGRAENVGRFSIASGRDVQLRQMQFLFLALPRVFLIFRSFLWQTWNIRGFGGTTLTTFEAMPSPISRPLEGFAVLKMFLQP